MFNHPVGNQLSTSNFDDKLRRITFDDSGVFRFDVLEHGRLSLVAALSTGHLGIVLGSGDDRQIKEALALDIFKTPKILMFGGLIFQNIFYQILYSTNERKRK